jgi:hypothetical protein
LTNRDNVQEYKAGIYSLASGKLIREFGHKGNGPKEFVSCSLDVRTNDSDIFYMEDVVQNKYWICSIDSLLENNDFQLKEFTYSRDVIRLCPIGNKYIGYNFWYIKEDEYTNNVPKLQEYEMVSGPKGRLGTGYDYFVANVTGGYVFTNPDNRDVWVADFYEGKIDIDNGADWNQSAPVDTKPKLEDFKKTVSDYLAWEVSNLLKNNKGDDSLGK